MKKKILLLFSMLAIVASVFIIKTSINRGDDVFNANLEALTQNESSVTCYLQTTSGGSIQTVVICNTGAWGTLSPFKCLGPSTAYVSSSTATCVYY